MKIKEVKSLSVQHVLSAQCPTLLLKHKSDWVMPRAAYYTRNETQHLVKTLKGQIK